MKTTTLLLVITATLLTLTACSPPEPSSETFLDGQKRALDKAKNVEKIGFEHKKEMDDIIEQANK